jgi:hypothetical protein
MLLALAVLINLLMKNYKVDVAAIAIIDIEIQKIIYVKIAEKI